MVIYCNWQALLNYNWLLDVFTTNFVKAYASMLHVWFHILELHLLYYTCATTLAKKCAVMDGNVYKLVEDILLSEQDPIRKQ